jgi:hypothetical protein
LTPILEAIAMRLLGGGSANEAHCKRPRCRYS